MKLKSISKYLLVSILTNAIVLVTLAQDKPTGSYASSADANFKPFYSDKPGTIADHGMVAATHPVASAVGVAILKQGGNAIDAAIATHFALAVVHPAAGNIAGGGFLVYRDAKGKSFTLDFREKAPSAASRDMYLDEKGNPIMGLSVVGHLSSGVSGSVDGMAEMHKKFSKLSWKTLLAPAISLAENGVQLTEREAKGLNRMRPEFLKYNPGTKYFAKPNGTEWLTGDTLIQKDLAEVLKRIAKSGKKGFYEGETAKLIVAEMKKGNGIITLEDLKNYNSVWRQPVSGTYKGLKIISMPPTSSGGIALLQLLKFVEPYPLKKWGWHADSTTQVMIEAERRVFADRSKWLGDQDFVKVPTKEMLSAEYLKGRWQDFDWNKATDSKAVAGGIIPAYESIETTHYSVVDSQGNAVAITTTLNNSYGSKIIVEGGGFIMNDEMDDFSIKPGVPNMFGLIGNEANSIRPNKRMLSSMTPTIIEKDGKLLMVLGTPGGSTIITQVFQAVLNVLEHGMGMQQAVSAARFHHQWLPDKTVFEINGFEESTLATLRKRGYVLELQRSTMGRMDCILVLPNNKLEGGADPRGDDTASGY